MMIKLLNVRHRAILKLSLPIIGGMISQNVLNLVDAAMVGRVGTSALASVGLGSFLNFVCAAMVMGLAVGVQTQCARLRGAGDPLDAVPLNGGLTLALVISVPLTVMLTLATPLLMSWVTESAKISSEGGAYLQARLLGLTAVGFNFAFRSYWSAVERTSIYLITLIVMHACNIFLNWVFIFGHLGAPQLGVEGAGLASSVSVWIGAALYCIFAFRYASDRGFLTRLPDPTSWRDLLRMSLPSGVERLFFALGMTTFMTFIGWIGEAELAASHVMISLFLVAILPGLGFGIASATFVAKSIGAQTPEDIPKWRRDVSLWALTFLSTIGVLFFIYHSEVISIFMTDPHPAKLARDVLVLMVVFLPAEALHMVIYQSLLGLGDNRAVMMINLGVQWGVSLPLIYVLGVLCGSGLVWVWVVHLGGRLLSLLLYTLRWRVMMRRLIFSQASLEA